jgi:hypothetical protein
LPALTRVDELRDCRLEVRAHVLLGQLAARLDGRAGIAGLDHLLDLADPRVARQRQGTALHELRAGVGRGVVRGGAHQAAREVARADGEIEHLGAHLADVDHARALVADAVDVAGGELRRGQAHVPAHGEREAARGRALEVRDHLRERAADLVGHVGVDLLAVQAADVVRLEDPGVNRHRRTSR